MRTLILSVLLCLMVALESTAIKYVQGKQEHKVPSEQIVFLVEVFKLVISCSVYGANLMKHRMTREENDDPLSVNARLVSSYREVNGYQEMDEDEIERIHEDPLERKGSSSIVWFILPACLYAVSNNVTFAALSLMSPALFNLLMNLKIPLTGFMACILLKYKLTTTLSISFIFLFIGSVFATLRREQDGSISIDGSLYGLILMFIYASCSAGAAVYAEYVMKKRYPLESVHIQNIKFCVCSMVANCVLIMLRGQIPFKNVQTIHLLSIIALSFNGLITSAVIKYAGSIVKTYAVSCAAFLSATFTWTFFHQKLQWNFYVGTVVCIIAVNLYIREKAKTEKTLYSTK
jgi:solute carrier family 35 (UDP-sugar transporter), member A1/2/3